MSLVTLIGFLFGHAASIRRVAGCRLAIWLALAMVLLAGIPREYDQEDLSVRPWVLAVPVLASAATATILFALLWLVTPRAANLGRTPVDGYRAFLTVYWMTAPLAWLYAIPAEQMYGAADSVRMNLALLGLVAAWRVLLITRVISVLTGMSWASTFFVVALFSDSIVLTVLTYTRVPLFNIMGGIHLSESEAILLDAVCAVRAWGTLTMPVWLIGAFTIGWRERERGSQAGDEPGDESSDEPLDALEPRPVAIHLWLLAAAMLAGGVAMLRAAQPVQQLKTRAEKLLADNQLEEALRLISDRGEDSFPPHWDPPPALGYGDEHPSILRLVELCLQPETAPWIRDLYVAKYWRHFGFYHRLHHYWDTLSVADFHRHLAVLERIWPEDANVDRQLTRALASEVGGGRRDWPFSLRERIRGVVNQHTDKPLPPILEPPLEEIE